MPPAPEILDAGCRIRMAEVFFEGKTENLSKADGHIAVSAEIKIDVKCIGSCGCPGPEHPRLARRDGPQQIRHMSQLICKKHLFGQTGHKAPDPLRRLLRVFVPVQHLRGYIRIFHDRSRDQLGKEGQIQSRRKDAFLRGCRSPAHINHIRKRLKGVEGNPDRQCDLRNRQCSMQPLIQQGNRHPCVLEHKKHSQVEQNRPCLDPHRFLFIIGACRDPPCGAVVHHDRRQHQENIDRLSICVKQDTGRQKDRIFRPYPGNGPFRQYHRRKEGKQERDGTEYHIISPLILILIMVS